MTTKDRSIIYDLLDVRIGNLAVSNIRQDKWGSTVTVECIYSYPPEEKTFKLVFKNCRAIQWYILKTTAEMEAHPVAQVITHDLGQANYQRTARIVTVTVEIIISYEELVVEKDW
jgi:hypothetical protein